MVSKVITGPNDSDGQTGFRSGYIAIAGRPNAGKSTLLNNLLDHPVSVVTAKPQTTRQRILGICQLKKTKDLPEGAQLLFIDTPGLHKSKRPLNRFLLDEALQGIEDADIVLYVLDGQKGITPDDRFAFERLKKLDKPRLLAINKVDLIRPKESLLPFIQEMDSLGLFDEIIPLSARKDKGLDNLKLIIARRLPQGTPFYPEDQITDRDQRFIASEVIRAELFRRLGKELPYSVAVEIENYQESKRLHRIQAVIFVERDSQKKIVVGQGGQMIKDVGTYSRKDLEKILGRKVFLELTVKTLQDWTSDAKQLKRLGYHR